MSKIVASVELPELEHRNPVAVALQKRHGFGVKKMKDRRQPRGGARNKQRDYREENY
jgi:hypothetical protein